MRKSVVWLVLLGFAVSFASCSKDDDPIPAIVGTWSRVSYEYTDLPSTFSYFDGYTRTDFGESGYTILVKGDGTYTRFFTVPSPYNLEDKGKWTLDDKSFKLAPTDTKDIDLIETLGIPGTEFTVVGDITDNRLKLSRVITLGLVSDADIADAGGDPNDVADEKVQGVDVTIVITFDKLN
jgi:hypothetical protein